MIRCICAKSCFAYGVHDCLAFCPGTHQEQAQEVGEGLRVPHVQGGGQHLQGFGDDAQQVPAQAPGPQR